MNKFLLIILIVLIILSSSYLIYKNLEQQKTLENFDNNINSLSTFYQNTVDSDDYQNTTNLFNYSEMPKIYKDNGWNGYWKDGTTLNGFFLSKYYFKSNLCFFHIYCNKFTHFYITLFLFIFIIIHIHF